MKFYKEYLLGNKAYTRNSEDEPWIELFPGATCTSIEILDEHEQIDFEDIFKISADIEFDTKSTDFDGLNPLTFEIKKKQIPNQIEKIENAGRRKSDRELF